MKHLKSVKNYMIQRFASKNDLEQDTRVNIDFNSSCTTAPCIKISCENVESAKNMEQFEISNCNFKLTYIQDAQSGETLYLIENKIHEYMQDAPKHIDGLQGVMFLKSNIKYSHNTISVEYEYNLLF